MFGLIFLTVIVMSPQVVGCLAQTAVDKFYLQGIKNLQEIV